MKLNNIRRAEGFTLPEVIMVVAVMAIVSAMAFPDIVSFFKRQSFEQEKIIQAEIVKALDAYAKAQSGKFNSSSGGGSEPAGGTYDTDMITIPMGEQTASGVYSNSDATACAKEGWGKMLSGYSNLSSEEICNDVWGLPRTYTAARDEVRYRDGMFNTYYVTILSSGEDKVLNTQITWNNADSYGSFKSNGDDIMEKYSDVKFKTELFEETLRRMDRIVEALDRYAQSRYNEALLSEEAATGSKIFYPPSNDDFSNMAAADTSAGIVNPRYGQQVLDDLKDNGGTTAVRYDSTAHKADMEGLMTVLGLPKEFCCDALTSKPFFYYSNPPIKGCPGDYRQQAPFMPPKLTIEPICNLGY